MKQSETEFVRIIKKNSSKTFYRHHSESMKVVQSLVSKIFNVIINRILDFDVGVKNMSTASKSLDIEYESSSDENDMIVDDEEKFSVLITHQYQASNTHKKIHKFYNKKARYYLSQITPISNEMNPLVKTHKLRGPLKIVSSIRITKDGLKHFHEQSEDEIYYLIAKNCNLSEEKSQEMKRADYRARKLRRWQAGKMACVKHSGNKYKD